MTPIAVLPWCGPKLPSVRITSRRIGPPSIRESSFGVALEGRAASPCATADSASTGCLRYGRGARASHRLERGRAVAGHDPERDVVGADPQELQRRIACAPSPIRVRWHVDLRGKRERALVAPGGLEGSPQRV